MTSEQLEASRAERMRHNGNGTLTLEDARTWIEETGLCLFLPRRQFSSSIAPSFVEAVAGQRDATPNPPQIAAAEELLVRLELDGVAVRLNLLGQPGEQPDYVVAGWVLPYVYALRGDRDWRRTPQLTGSRQVSPLAVQAYKLLEAGDTTITNLAHTLGREVTEVAVLRAITELWQQLRIIPVIQAPGKAAEWQLLRLRFQKAIAEGASTSQVTAISVLASIYLQAVIAATMEDVEVFLSALTARSKVREVLRGLVATRQVHTLSLGHAPHFYVAGTLPEFAVATSIYANANLPSSAYYMKNLDDYDEEPETPLAGVREPVKVEDTPAPVVEELVAVEAVAEATDETPAVEEAPKVHAPGRPASGKPLVDRSDRNRPESKAVEHKLAQAAASSQPVPHTAAPESHPARRPASDSHRPSNGSRSASGSRPASSARPATRSASGSRPATGSRPSSGARPASGSRSASGARPASGSRPTNGSRPTSGARSASGSRPASSGARPASGSRPSSSARPASGSRPTSSARPAGKFAKSDAPAWKQRSSTSAKPGGNSSSTRSASPVRKDSSAHSTSRKPTTGGSARPAGKPRFTSNARPSSQGAKKRG